MKADDLFRALRQSALSHDIGEETLFLAEELTESAWSLDAHEKFAVAALFVAATINQRRGATCLPLSGGVRGPLGSLLGDILTAADIDEDISQLVRRIRKLAKSDALDHVFGQSGDYRPLILCDDRLYLHRHEVAERRLAAALDHRLSMPNASADTQAAVQDAIAHSSMKLAPGQEHAVCLALERPLSVITGGPGTGKTAVTVTLTRALVRTGVAPEDIVLAAPTGKAAQRMTESLQAALANHGELPAADASLAASPPRALTLHRLLGYQPATEQFIHHARNPVRALAVIVDEASMIDVGLMGRLMEALPDECSLVLVGDAEQLPSVDAGTVLSDLAQWKYEPAFVARLTENFRMAKSEGGSAILRAAEGVRRGSARSLTKQMLRDVDLSAFLKDWRDDVVPRQTSTVVRIDDAGVATQDSAHYLDELFASFEGARLLTVTRRGPTGADAINAALSGHKSTLDLGTPVIVRKNDYRRALFNGDHGVICLAENSAGRQTRQVAFKNSSGYRVLPIGPIAHLLDPAFALTVHQSQGSEFDRVAVILPTKDTPLLSRELLYTALTRARSRAEFIGDPSIAKAAIKKPVRRHSGLLERLTATAYKNKAS